MKRPPSPPQKKEEILSHVVFTRKKQTQKILFKIKLTSKYNAFKMLPGKPTGKRPLGRPRRRWEDNIRMDLRWEDNIRMDLEEIGINTGNWVDSAQDRDYWRALVNAALNLRVP